MRAGTKKTLAECLETDDSYSEMVHDDMWTRNSAGLHIARNSGILDMLETKVEALKAGIRKTQAEYRGIQTECRGGPGHCEKSATKGFRPP